MLIENDDDDDDDDDEDNNDDDDDDDDITMHNPLVIYNVNKIIEIPILP